MADIRMSGLELQAKFNEAHQRIPLRVTKSCGCKLSEQDLQFLSKSFDDNALSSRQIERGQAIRSEATSLGKVN